METPNPKCSGCKCYWKPDETDIKTSGLYFKTCKKCRKNQTDYFENNRDKTNEDITCVCGATLHKRNYKRHGLFQTHKDFIKKSQLSSDKIGR
jgi:hypothetical protein